jgi:hypothetical protein
MSTEQTIVEGKEDDWFINKDLLSGVLTLYVDYGLTDVRVVELTDELIKGIAEAGK